MQLVRIQIVDDFRPWVNLLQSIIENAVIGQVICTATDGHVALAKAEELKPDLVLLDINIPKINGIDLARSIQRIQPRPLVLFVSHHETPVIVRAAIEAGGNGFVLKSYVRQDLERAIKVVCQGELFLTDRLKAALDQWVAIAGFSPFGAAMPCPAGIQHSSDRSSPYYPRRTSGAFRPSPQAPIHNERLILFLVNSPLRRCYCRDIGCGEHEWISNVRGQSGSCWHSIG